MPDSTVSIKKYTKTGLHLQLYRKKMQSNNFFDSALACLRHVEKCDTLKMISNQTKYPLLSNDINRESNSHNNYRVKREDSLCSLYETNKVE